MLSGSMNPSWQFYKATIFEWFQKSRSTSGLIGVWGHWWLGLDIRNFFFSYVFEVKESIFRCLTKQPGSGNFENPDQLPVLQVLEGRLLVNIIIGYSSFLNFPLVRLEVDSRLTRGWLEVDSTRAQFPTCSTRHLFKSRSRNPFFAVSQSYHIRVYLKI